MKYETPVTKPMPDSVRREKVVSETPPNPHALDEAIHPLLVAYPTSYLAKGGEHFVFNVGKKKVPEQMRDIVVKGNIQYARKLQERGANDFENMEELPVALKEEMLGSIKKDRKKYEQFRSYFGESNVSPQRKYLMRVPVSKEMATEVFPRAGLVPHEVWTLVTVQKRAEELGPEYATRRFDIGARYAEIGPRVTPEAYAESSAHLFAGEPRDRRMEEGTEIMEEIEPRNARLLRIASREPGLKEQLVDFIRKAIEYTEDTGEILDLIGKDNVTFVYDMKPDGSKIWRYKITDGFFAWPNSKRLKNAEAAVSEMMIDGEMPDASVSDFMNAANYVRAINSMAEQLGIPERLGTFQGLTKETYMKMMTETRRVWYSEKKAA